MEDGGREQQGMVIGNVGAEHGPQLDMEEMMERSLTMIRKEHPGIMRSIDWHLACQGLCRNEECTRCGRVMMTTVSCNQVIVQLCPTGRDSSQEMLNRMMATAESTHRPCPCSSQDMYPKGAEYVQGTPHILVIHARRARHDATRDRGRVEFAERIHVRDDWHRLIAVSRYADPEDWTSIQGALHDLPSTTRGIVGPPR